MPKACTTLSGSLDWPQNGQALRRTYRPIRDKTRVVSTGILHGIASLTLAQARAMASAKFWSEHSTIGNRVHYVGDLSLREDAAQLRPGHPLRMLVALRNARLNPHRANRWCYISDSEDH